MHKFKRHLVLGVAVLAMLSSQASSDVQVDAAVATIELESVNVLLRPEKVDFVGRLAAVGVGFEERLLVPYVPPEPEEVILAEYKVPNGEEGCKSWNITYMPYTAVTSKRSDQYKLLNSPEAYTDETTGLRMYEGRYCIAVGSYYSQKIGTKLNLVMSNGSVVKCITGDAKSDAHTDETHRYQAFDGSVAEVIVDYKYFRSSKQYPEELRGSIMAIQLVS